MAYNHAMHHTNPAKVAALAPLVGRVSGANNRIVVGQIGLGGCGKYGISVCQRNPGLRVAAVCDVYRPLVTAPLP